MLRGELVPGLWALLDSGGADAARRRGRSATAAPTALLAFGTRRLSRPQRDRAAKFALAKLRRASRRSSCDGWRAVRRRAAKDAAARRCGRRGGGASGDAGRQPPPCRRARGARCGHAQLGASSRSAVRASRRSRRARRRRGRRAARALARDRRVGARQSSFRCARAARSRAAPRRRAGGGERGEGGELVPAALQEHLQSAVAGVDAEALLDDAERAATDARARHRACSTG